MWDHLESFRIISESFRTNWKPFGIIFSHLEPLGIIWNNLGVILNHLGIIWDTLESFGTNSNIPELEMNAYEELLGGERT